MQKVKLTDGREFTSVDLSRIKLDKFNKSELIEMVRGFCANDNAPVSENAELLDTLGFQMIARSPEELKLALLIANKLKALDLKELAGMFECAETCTIGKDFQGNDAAVRIYISRNAISQKPQFGWDVVANNSWTSLAEKEIEPIRQKLKISLDLWDMVPVQSELD